MNVHAVFKETNVKKECDFVPNPSKPPLIRGDLKASPLTRGD
jgi:hypothetical protein